MESNSREHADDKIRKANELINADRKTRKRLDNKEKNQSDKFKKLSVPITSKFKSPNQKEFGHFKKPKIEKISNNKFAHFKK